jgi:hypothetical protein
MLLPHLFNCQQNNSRRTSVYQKFNTLAVSPRQGFVFAFNFPLKTYYLIIKKTQLIFPFFNFRKINFQFNAIAGMISVFFRLPGSSI